MSHGPALTNRSGLQAPPAPKAVAGFLLSGFLFALLGAILPAWGYHLSSDFFTVGNYFLCLAIGVIVSRPLAQWLLSRRSLSFLLFSACVVSCAALLYLAVVPLLRAPLWRMAGLFTIGLSIGLLNTGLFHAISPSYQTDPAATVNTGGIFFGMGSIAAAVLVAGTYYVYTVPSILILVAVVPGYFALLYAKSTFPAPTQGHQPTVREAFRDLTSLGAVLFALLLFFQFGNEWALAGWLPLFLIRRLGMSPETSLFLLGFYWLALVVGRVIIVSALPRVRHGRLLVGSAAAAMLGCLILLSTNNEFGAGTGILMIGGGYASIYPLVAEKIGRRFPYYNPALFNGIFSFALMGGMLAPATLGYAAQFWGVGIVMALPMMGTVMVFLLLMLIWLESKVTGR